MVDVHEDPERRNGTVKWFNSSKGFGYIVDDTGNEIFAHQSNIMADGYRTLGEGERVEFSIGIDTQDRRKAVKITGLNGGPVVGDQRGPRGGRRSDFRGGDDSDRHDDKRGGGGDGDKGGERGDDRRGGRRRDDDRRVRDNNRSNEGRRRDRE